MISQCPDDFTSRIDYIWYVFAYYHAGNHEFLRVESDLLRRKLRYRFAVPEI